MLLNFFISLTMENKIHIYQAMVRLFGNRCLNNIPNGDMEQNGCGLMNDFNEAALNVIADLGCNYIWYTGLIQHASKTTFPDAKVPHSTPSIVKGKAGSPYAINDYYSIHAALASDPEKRFEEFEKLIERSHKAGLKVIIDFVPNHVAREYDSSVQHPKHPNFGEFDRNDWHFAHDNNFYYFPGEEFRLAVEGGAEGYSENPAKATGNNCFTPHPSINDWYETIKLNYGIDYSDCSRHFDPYPNTWHRMLDILLYWCYFGIDGFRCDMAHMVPVEFWNWAITEVKKQYPHVIFIGELYDHDIYRQYIEKGGFDLLYDKVGLYDTLRAIVTNQGSARDITRAWQRTEGLQSNMLYFLENHDEQRIASEFFAEDPFAAIPAMMVSAWMNTNSTMIYFGQELGESGMDSEGFSGKDGRTSIFDYWGLEKLSRLNNNGIWSDSNLTAQEKGLRDAYKKILTLAMTEKAISKGKFFDLMYANPDSLDFDGNKVYTFIRMEGEEFILFVINFSSHNRFNKIYIPNHAFEHLNITPKSYDYHDLLSDYQGSAYLDPDTQFEVETPKYGAVALKFCL